MCTKRWFDCFDTWNLWSSVANGRKKSAVIRESLRMLWNIHWISSFRMKLCRHWQYFIARPPFFLFSRWYPIYHFLLPADLTQHYFLPWSLRWRSNSNRRNSTVYWYIRLPFLFGFIPYTFSHSASPVTIYYDYLLVASTMYSTRMFWALHRFNAITSHLQIISFHLEWAEDSWCLFFTELF